MKKIKPMITFLLCAALLLTLASVSAQTPENTWTVSKSKEAANLVVRDNGSYTTDVTLSLPASESKQKADVVFVLDKSMISQDAEYHLDRLPPQVMAYLSSHENVEYKVGFVICTGDPYTALDLTPLTEENRDALYGQMTEVFFQQTLMGNKGGSNLHGGLVKADLMLSADTAVDDRFKYVITISDGIVYYWNSDDGNDLYTIGRCGNNNENYDVTPSHQFQKDGSENYYKNYDGTQAYNGVAGPRPSFSYLYNQRAGYDNDAWSKYDMPGRKADGTLNRGGTNTAEIAGVPVEELAAAPTCIEKGIYMAAHQYGNMSQKYRMISLYWDWPSHSDNYHPMGTEFMKWAGEQGKGYNLSGHTPEQAEEYFNEIQNVLLYDLAAGSYVEDVFGSGFSLAAAEYPFSLTVNGEAASCEKTDENTYVFDGGKYTVTYDPDGKFRWDISTPTGVSNRVQLTYTLELTNPETAPGTYGRYDRNGSQGYAGIRTNERATLYPMNSAGQTAPAENFSKPTVSYTVGSSPVISADSGA